MNLRNKLAFFIALNSYVELITRGTSPLSLPKAIANSLSYVKTFGGTEQRNIPAEYTQVEYLESDGNQYIDLGYPIDSTRSFHLKSRCLNTGFVFGSRTTNNTNVSSFNYDSVDNLFGIRMGNTILYKSTSWTENTDYEIYISDGDTKINGTTVSTTAYGTSFYSGNAYLFTINNNGVPASSKFSINRIYYFQMLKNGVLTQNLIPCRRNSDNVLGMYDTVSGTFFTNAGTGTFTAGSDAVPTPDTPMDIWCNNGVLKARHQSGLPLGYTRLDYLQGDGASYLIVPYRVNNKTVFYCRYNEIQKGLQLASAIFGVTDTPDMSRAYNGILRLSNGTSYFNRMGWGDSTSGSIINVNAPQVLDTWYEVLYDQNKLYQDNVLYATSATSNDTEWVANCDLGIFARSGSSVTMPAIAKISSVWAKENSEYKINLIPARRNSDNVLGMYDLVSGQFFTNQGTGTFTAGNPVSDPVEIYTDGTVETIKDSLNNTATAEMLLKVGDYQDVQSIIDGVVTRNVGIVILDGTENWSLGTVFSADNVVQRAVFPSTSMSTHFVGNASSVSPSAFQNNSFKVGASGYRNRIYIKATQYADETEFKAFLAQQYANGTPVILVYPLATPTTESVAGQTLQVTDGDNVLEITQASLNNLELEAKYESRS